MNRTIVATRHGGTVRARKGSALPYILGVVGVVVASGLLFPPLSTVGALPAVSEERQKDEKHSAESDGDPLDRLPAGMDSFRDLLAEEKVTREFVEALAARVRAVEARERQVERREKELAVLQQDLTKRMQRVELAKAQLKQMTQEVEEEREAQLMAAVKSYKGMEPADAARELNEMDLKLVVEVLKRVTPTSAVSKLLVAMRKDVEAEKPQAGKTGTESEEEKTARQAKLRRLKDINEMLADPVRANR